MSIKKSLKKIKELYSEGRNIISYLKQVDGRTENTSEDIMISYDFQAGSYNNRFRMNQEFYNLYHEEIANILLQYIKSGGNIMEAGVGEATTLAPVIKRIGIEKFKRVYGFDISWSRLKYAEEFMNDIWGETNKSSLFVGDLKEIPCKDNSIDVVYTVHAIEPNGGCEEEILKELYRVCSEYLILIEPAYDLANEEAKARMVEHGYVTKLYETAVALGYEIVSHELLNICANPLNPSGVIVIKKGINMKLTEDALCDPVTKQDLIMDGNIAYCQNSMLAYPIVLNIPILCGDNAIIATKYMDFR